eukprot:6185671-Pleurochrysis_carterae.AAC.1
MASACGHKSVCTSGTGHRRSTPGACLETAVAEASALCQQRDWIDNFDKSRHAVKLVCSQDGTGLPKFVFKHDYSSPSAAWTVVTQASDKWEREAFA